MSGWGSATDNWQFSYSPIQPGKDGSCMDPIRLLLARTSSRRILRPSLAYGGLRPSLEDKAQR
jgi:hypothetical protein